MNLLPWGLCERLNREMRTTCFFKRFAASHSFTISLTQSFSPSLLYSNTRTHNLSISNLNGCSQAPAFFFKLLTCTNYFKMSAIKDIWRNLNWKNNGLIFYFMLDNICHLLMTSLFSLSKLIIVCRVVLQ